MGQVIILYNEIMGKVGDIINDILGEDTAILGGTYIRDETSESDHVSLGFSSIDIVDLISQLEIEYDCEFNEESIVAIRTIDDVIKGIMERINGGA